MVGGGKVPPGWSPGQDLDQPSLPVPLTPSSNDDLSPGNQGLIPTKFIFAFSLSNAATK